MFYRSIIPELEKWFLNPNRKPLVIRGARQVGKTTLVNFFAERFDQYIYLNLELAEDKQPFEQFTNIETLIQTLFFLKNKVLTQKSKTLLFIDEIQELPEAINILRYFYEKEQDIPVIAAGSMLETLLDKSVSFPVGRVEYKVLRPVSFPEFLIATGEKAALEQLQKIPIASFAHTKLLSLFHTYALIGGMPEVVNHYAQHKDLTALSSIYDSLITSYTDDAEKYAANTNQLQMIRHAIGTSFAQAGKRIKYQGFGNSNYGSREMGEVLRTLEKALLIYLVYPHTGFTLPLLPDLKKSPRMQVLDTGLLNYFVGIQKEIIGSADLNSVYQGTMIEHLVGQELLAAQYNALSSIHFWVREKKTSTAELDYLYVFDEKLIPLEVKSGVEGKLKSLHLFMEEAPHNLAVRVYAGELNIQFITTTKRRNYYLLNLPYYLVSQIERYVEWFQKEVKNKE
jgi:predicted AAA+ superfamily ATPase